MALKSAWYTLLLVIMNNSGVLPSWKSQSDRSQSNRWRAKTIIGMFKVWLTQPISSQADKPKQKHWQQSYSDWLSWYEDSLTLILTKTDQHMSKRRKCKKLKLVKTVYIFISGVQVISFLILRQKSHVNFQQVCVMPEVVPKNMVSEF